MCFNIIALYYFVTCNVRNRPGLAQVCVVPITWKTCVADFKNKSSDTVQGWGTVRNYWKPVKKVSILLQVDYYAPVMDLTFKAPVTQQQTTLYFAVVFSFFFFRENNSGKFQVNHLHSRLFWWNGSSSFLWKILKSLACRVQQLCLALLGLSQGNFDRSCQDVYLPFSFALELLFIMPKFTIIMFYIYDFTLTAICLYVVNIWC